MKRKTTRRCYNVSPVAYWRITNYAKKTQGSRSGVLEDIINEKLDSVGAPTVDPKDPRIFAKKVDTV